MQLVCKILIVYYTHRLFYFAAGRDEPRAAVTPFTRESARRAGSRGAQLVREFGFMPRRRLSVEDGARLPRKYEPFPPKLYGRPLEEIDNFIYDEVSLELRLYEVLFSNIPADDWISLSYLLFLLWG